MRVGAFSMLPRACGPMAIKLKLVWTTGQQVNHARALRVGPVANKMKLVSSTGSQSGCNSAPSGAPRWVPCCKAACAACRAPAAPDTHVVREASQEGGSRRG